MRKYTNPKRYFNPGELYAWQREKKRDEQKFEAKKKRDVIPSKIGKYGLQLTQMLNKTRDTAIKNLNLVENAPQVLQYDAGYGIFEPVGPTPGKGIPGYFKNAFRTPLQRIDVKPDVPISKAKEALGENWDQFVTEKYNVSPELFDKFGKGSTVSDFKKVQEFGIPGSGKGDIAEILSKWEKKGYTLDPVTGSLEKIAGKAGEEVVKEGGKELVKEGGKGLVDKFGVVGPAIAGTSAAYEASEGNYMEAAHDVARMGYKPLAAAGPYGWLAIGINELWDLLD